MKTFVVTILLAVLAQSSAPQQRKSTEQPCTGATLIGTWQFAKTAGEAAPASEPTSLKHVTPTHFFVVGRQDSTGLASYGHGGPYTVSGITYTESITHGFGAPFSQLRGMSVSFQCSIEGDVWHIIGQIGDQKFDEYWRRVPAAAAK
jgi:hypothetical protein